MMVAATPREQLLSAYRRQPADTMALSIYGRYLPRGANERLARNLGLGIIEPVPVTSLVAPPWHILPGFVSQVKSADLDISFSWRNGTPIETRTYRTPVGAVYQQTRKDPSYGSDWISKFYVERPQDYVVLQYIVENTVFRKNEDLFRAKIRELGDDGVVLGRVDRCPYQKVLIELAGPERFLLDLSTNSEPVLELLQALNRKMDEAFSLVLESEVEVIWQPDNITSATTPPKYFEKYCAPFYARHGTACRQAGKTYLVHIDGRTKALKHLIASCPIDGVESFSLPEAGGDLNLSEACSVWPDKAILPNFPASFALRPRSDIEAFLAQFLSGSQRCDIPMLQFSEDLPPSELDRVLRIVCEYVRVQQRVTRDVQS